MFDNDTNRTYKYYYISADILNAKILIRRSNNSFLYDI